MGRGVGRRLTMVGELSRRARGWLRHVYAKVNQPHDDWSHRGQPAAGWDNKTDPPVSNWYRFDPISAAPAVAMMADATPAWREVYAEILAGFCDRLILHHGFDEWITQRGNDPRRRSYPQSWKGTLVPEELWGHYNSPGWAGNGLQAGGYQPDPIASEAAIYYKGFLNFVLGCYARVAQDERYQRPFDLVFDDEHRWSYTHRDVNESIIGQWAEARPGVACEVHKVWPL